MGASARWEEVGKLDDENVRELSVEQALRRTAEAIDSVAYMLSVRGRATVSDIERLVAARDEVTGAVEYWRACRLKLLVDHPCKRG